MTKQEQKQYLQNFVASQGAQVGLGITPLSTTEGSSQLVYSEG